MWRSATLPLDPPIHDALAMGRSAPDVTTLFNGWTRLTTDAYGEMGNLPLEGFFFTDTQFVSYYRLYVNGEPLKHGFCTQISPSEWCGLFVVPKSMESGDLPENTIPRGSLEIRVLRTLNHGQWKEAIFLKSYSTKSRGVELQIDFACPIEDLELAEEMKQDSESAPLGLVPEVLDTEEAEVALRYRRDFGARNRTPTRELSRLLGEDTPREGERVVRTLEICARITREGASKPHLISRPGTTTKLAFEFDFDPLGHAEVTMDFLANADGAGLMAEKPTTHSSPPRKPSECLSGHTRIRTANSIVNLIVAQAQVDLEALKLPVFGAASTSDYFGFTAGIPRYIGVFGRDILTTSWQAALFTPKYMESALGRIASYQGVHWDSWRDEEPGRLPHERRLDPRAALGETNRELYYGDVVSTPFWIVALANAYQWTGDRGLLERFKPTFDACVRWVERRLKKGGGFVYYAPAAPGCNRHHAWKDSGDAIVDGQGRVRVPPLAAVEIQGYCYLALLCAAGVALALGEVFRAKRFYGEAVALKKRFNEAFWMPERKYFAMALDADRNHIDSIGSNVGHSLGCGIIRKDYFDDVVGRLMSPDLFSGWGIRTLSADNPGFDPFSYHRGTVWPVENATIAGSFRLCGYQGEAARLTEAQFALATHFESFRLPEVVSGQTRSERYPSPGLYPYANLLQAWSVSAIPFMMQSLLGIRPMAPLHTLIVAPSLPAWLPWVELENLSLGSAKINLRFWREQDGRSRWEVTKREGHAFVIEQPPDLAPEATLWNRLKAAV